MTIPRRRPGPVAGRTLAAAAAALFTLGACSPALDWREVRPPDGGAVVLLPCKPDHHARKVRLAGGAVELTLSSCRAADVTWAIAAADLGDPSRVPLALDELRTAALANLGATEGRALPLSVEGATPNPASVRLAIAGRLPDGQSVQEQTAVFAKGTRVFQATCVGAHLPADGVEVFFGSLRTPA